eukprot:scaffold171194_cov33-Tisochrysis_lutea.AAC.3
MSACTPPSRHKRIAILCLALGLALIAHAIFEVERAGADSSRSYTAITPTLTCRRCSTDAGTPEYHHSHNLRQDFSRARVNISSLVETVSRAFNAIEGDQDGTPPRWNQGGSGRSIRRGSGGGMGKSTSIAMADPSEIWREMHERYKLEAYLEHRPNASQHLRKSYSRWVDTMLRMPQYHSRGWPAEDEWIGESPLATT